MNQYFELGETFMNVDGRRWMNVVELISVYEKKWKIKYFGIELKY
jgi:hypothetical protein